MERGRPFRRSKGAFGDHFEGLGAPLEVHFGDLGWPWAPLGIILRVLGHPWKSILGSWGGLGRAFWDVGPHFCTLETRFTILQLQTDTNEVRKNRTEVLGPPPEPEFCALSFWNDRGSPLAPSDSVLFEKLMIF